MFIDRFRASFRDFLRPNLYEVEFHEMPQIEGITSFDLRNMTLLCKEASFPFLTFNVAETFYNGIKKETVQGADYDPVTLNFMIDDNSTPIKFANNWIKAIKDEHQNFAFKKEYSSNIVIILKDLRGFDKAKVTLHDAFPVNIEPISLGYDQNDVISEISMSFAYDNATYEFGDGLSTGFDFINKFI